MANFNIDYLVVAGGGGGASGIGASGGGGGAGEYLYKTSQTLTTGGSGYAVTVGGGGVGGNANLSTSTGGQGGDSIFIQTTKGGGFGRPASGSNPNYGEPGGSGGGGAYTGAGGASTTVSPGLGNAGGNGFTPPNYSAGGGGGAGSAGSNGSSGNGGNGGAGVQNPITVASGSGPFYAAGGGGGIYNQTTASGFGGSLIGGNSYNTQNATGGAANTGSGGGGGSYRQTPNNIWSGGAGSSGVVILRYTTADIASYTTTGITPTVDTTTVSGQTILSYTTVGTGAINFTASQPPFSGTRVTNPVTGFESSVEIGLKIPSGNNSNQPTGAQGMIRNNTSRNTGGSVNAIEHYNGTAWKYFAATGSFPTSLKMYLDANDVASNPGSGTVWTDLTGNGNNGALVGSTFQSGTPKYVNIPGTDTSAIRVNLAGTGGTTQVTNLVGGTQPLTVQGYCYFSSSGSGYDYFFIFGNSIPSAGSLVSIAKFDPADASTPNRLYMYDNSNVLLSNYTASLNTWYNLAVSVTGNTYKLYVNGVLEYTATGSTKNILSNTAQIGSYSPSSTSYGNNLTGRVGEFRVYQAVLTGTEILANFNNTKATYGL